LNIAGSAQQHGAQIILFKKWSITPYKSHFSVFSVYQKKWPSCEISP
jgi:hypothetical protein